MAAGTGDNAAAAVGLGVVPGEPIVSLGTSGTVFCVATDPVTDPSGMVAGFADATDLYLPLSAALNCTVAVDRMAQLLGLDRDAVADHTEAVVLPWFDGERTPNYPNARASILGLTHHTTPEEVLWASYLGAAWSLVVALERIDELTGGLAEHAPLTLVGGGAQGSAWWRALGRLTGRALRVPAATELVALGGAALAAALVTGESPYEVAARWQGDTARTVEAVEVDEQARSRLAAVTAHLHELNSAGFDTDQVVATAG